MASQQVRGGQGDRQGDCWRCRYIIITDDRGHDDADGGDEFAEDADPAWCRLQNAPAGQGSGDGCDGFELTPRSKLQVARSRALTEDR